MPRLSSNAAYCIATVLTLAGGVIAHAQSSVSATSAPRVVDIASNGPVFPLDPTQAPYVDDSTRVALQSQVDMLTERLARLEAEQRQDSQVQAAIVQTPVTEHDYETSGFIQRLSDHWKTIEDPEIAVVNWQTGVKTDDKKEPGKKDEKKKEKKWYDRLAMRGYTQMRISDVTHLDPGSAPAQVVGDRSVGDYQGFLLRRVRLIIFGDVSDHMGVYLQPDFAITPPNSTDQTYFAQIRDWYADCYFDKTKIHRVRVGQSKIPYGWENMQSSSNRIALDRTDGINSAQRNERDLGVFYYWTPEPAQEFFKEVLEKGLKGSGNYGVFGFGCYNGQGGSLLEQNDNLHIVARLTIPVQFESGQYVEASVQGYSGKYVVLSSPIRAIGITPNVTPTGTLGANDRVGIRDERIAASFIWYPQPFGFQAEWNVGRGPALDASQMSVVEDDLQGGYAQIMYNYKTPCHGTFFPFARYAYYNGGYKSERNAPQSHIDEFETGCEWQMNPQMELTTSYTWTDRTNTTAFNQAGIVPYEQFAGQFVRFQFQFNY